MPDARCANNEQTGLDMGFCFFKTIAGCVALASFSVATASAESALSCYRIDGSPVDTKCIRTEWRTDNNTGHPYQRISNLCMETSFTITYLSADDSVIRNVQINDRQGVQKLYFNPDDADAVRFVSCTLARSSL